MAKRNEERKPKSEKEDTPGARKLFRGIALVMFAATIVFMGFTLRDELDGDVRTKSRGRRSSVRTVTRDRQPVDFRITMMMHWLGAAVPAAMGVIILRKTRRTGSQSEPSKTRP